MASEVETKLKAELMAEIARTNDPAMRTILALLVGVFEVLIGKLDEMAADEKGLREAVLNGHAENHDRDHDWITEQIHYKKQAAEERAWVRSRMASDCAKACEWTKEKMEAEKTAAEDAKADRRKARDTVINLVVTAALSSAATIVGVLWAVK